MENKDKTGVQNVAVQTLPPGPYKYDREELARRLKSLDRDLKHAKEILQDTCQEFDWIVEHLTKKKEHTYHQKRPTKI